MTSNCKKNIIENTRTHASKSLHVTEIKTQIQKHQVETQTTAPFPDSNEVEREGESTALGEKQGRSEHRGLTERDRYERPRRTEPTEFLFCQSRRRRRKKTVIRKPFPMGKMRRKKSKKKKIQNEVVNCSLSFFSGKMRFNA